ncbi:MAG: hypothetical protein ACREN5_14490, partial [Gemmatimonadales bacterium]
MHIEMTELLRCPAGHPEAFLVLATAEMRDRTVRRGAVGCPVCGAEFPIRDGVVDFTGYGTPSRAQRGIRDTGYGSAAEVSSPASRIPHP